MSERIMLFIPAYRCEKQISRVLDKFTPEQRRIFSEVLVIDNQSPDGTVNNAVEAAKKMAARANIAIKVLRNTQNVSLGGTHKAAFNYAITNKFDYVCILHGDDQGDVNDLVKALDSGKHKELDYYLGARFLPDSQLDGYSWWRIFGNKFFNLLFSIIVGKKLHDLGSGMNIFSVKDLSERFYTRFPNRLTFNYYFILYLCAHNKRFAYFPHRWAEDDQVSNLKLFRAVKEIILLLWQYMRYNRKMFEALPPDGLSYEMETLYDSKTSA